ncbi:MAG: hypothetical protein ACKO8Z_14835, partial [Prosthecobacter sp.]
MAFGAAAVDLGAGAFVGGVEAAFESALAALFLDVAVSCLSALDTGLELAAAFFKGVVDFLIGAAFVTAFFG